MATRRMIEMAARPDRNPVVGCLISDDATAIVPNRMVHPEPWQVHLAGWFVQRHARDLADLDKLAQALGIGGV